MLTKNDTPRTKRELIEALQRSQFRTVSIYEGPALRDLPRKEELVRSNATVIIIRA